MDHRAKCVWGIMANEKGGEVKDELSLVLIGQPMVGFIRRESDHERDVRKR